MGGDESAVHVQRVVRGFLGRLTGQDGRRNADKLTVAGLLRRQRGVCYGHFSLRCSQCGSDRIFPVRFCLTSCTHLSRYLAALRQANLVYEKIFDPRTHAYYYYNTRTFETTWQVTNVVFMRATHALLRCPAGIARCITS